jgi:hypothetical protein
MGILYNHITKVVYTALTANPFMTTSKKSHICACDHR